MTRQRRRLTVDGQENKRMNDATYALRRQVMAYIYEARKIIPADQFRRIDVRITTPTTGRHSGALGVARLNDDIIWIPEGTCKAWKDELRQVVFHEVVHALTGFAHDESCKLMAPIVCEPLSKAQCDRLLRKYFN